MEYKQSLEYIHSLNRFGIHPGLERIEALCAAVGNPQKKLKFVHVAGTNGKGSTSTMLANILRQSGKKVGLFTSPYVADFRERIQIDGLMVEEEVFASAVTQLEPIVSHLAEKDMQPTEFEVITAAALIIFDRCSCDICVLEVGLGGRLDSTNIIPVPLVSVIASISMDHMAILGNTIEEIAHEKCGIIKNGGTTVCYPEQADSVCSIVESTCKSRCNRLIIPDVSKIKNVESSIFGDSFSYDNLNIQLSMGGEYQVLNAVTALEAARVLGSDAVAIERGILQAVVPARMEIISRSPLVILDGGHNEDGGSAVAKSLKNALSGKRILAVTGMMADKNFDAYLAHIAPLCSTIIATSVADNPRSLSSDDLKQAASKYCKDVISIPDACNAIDEAKKKLGSYDCLLVCGSLYLAGQVRDKMKNIFGSSTI